MVPDPSSSMSDKTTSDGSPAFDGEPTDITALLKELITRDDGSDRVVVIATDGVEPNSTDTETSQNDRFLRLLQEFDLRLVGTRPVEELSDEFPGIDSTRRKTIAESLEES